MSMSAADLRFLIDRGVGLVRRGLSSLHSRGARATWKRLTLELRPIRTNGRGRPWFPPDAPFAPFSVPIAAAPRASIVIPVYNEFAHTLACLRAIAAHPPRAACEVIVVDDGSTDQTASALAEVQGLGYLRRAGNGGFVAACNDGARQAKASILVFLNNDTVPQPGWLDAMLDTLDTYPSAGLVGAQLLYPDGRLQEAGGVVFADGSGWNYGRNESPDDPRFSFVRDADYCSGAAIALPRALFEALGGFDVRYAPAYYEDTDLAFAVRAAGHRVLYQPAARVVHVEGATAGTDPRQGVKAFQQRNRHIFVERWRAELERLPAPATPSAGSVHGCRPQVLVIDALVPDPARDSGSLRLVNLMRLLQEHGAHVVFLSSDHTHAPGSIAALQQHGIETWPAPHTKRVPAWLREHGRRFDCIQVCRHYVARDFMPLLRRHAPQARLLFDTVDLHYLREQRAAEILGDGTLARRAARTRELELDIVARADVTLVVSELERELLARDAPNARVEVLSNLHRVSGPGLPFAQRRDLVFVGGFRHPPNVDAVCWFVTDVFPLIRQRLPDVVFHCIGDHAPAEILALTRCEGVRIHGHVPDIAPWMDGCRIAVAPLRYGAGVKGKVNLSMAHGQPVVATSCAVEGMHLSDGRDVLVADDAGAFAQAVARLYSDEALWQRLSRLGLDNVQRHFSIDAARSKVRELFLPGESQQPPRPASGS
jgi:O-antigen biosynthesis protein